MYKFSKLSSGIRVGTDSMPDAHTVAVSVWVDVGARYESAEQNGVSHLLEHMAFKGTKRRNAKQIAEEFDLIGGHSNAYTSREHTVYYAKVLKENTEKALDIIADILENSTIDKKELERERGVILQEIAQTEDSPDDIVFDYFQETAFPSQSLGRPILGSTELIKKFSSDDIISYMEGHYANERIFVCAAGNIDHNEFAGLTEKHFRKKRNLISYKKEEAKYKGGDFRKQKDLEQMHLILGFNAVPYMKDEYYGVQLLSTILGGGMSSRLFQEVREKRGLCYAIQPYISSYSDSGLFSVYSGTSEKTADELLTVVIDELKKATENISDEEFEKARNQLKTSILMDQESTISRAEEIGRTNLSFGKFLSAEDIIKKIDAVNKKDSMQLLRKVISSQKPTLAALGNVKNLMPYEKILEKLSH